MKNYGCKMKNTLIIENQMIVQEISNSSKKSFEFYFNLSITINRNR